MKRSREIEDVVRGVIDAFDRGDTAYIERTTSRDPGVVVIGTDPGEYATGYERVMGMLREGTPGPGQPIHVRVTELRGYEDGDVALADGTGVFERDGESVDIRFTAVLVREQGDWRVVQNHASIGVPNDKMFEPLFGRARAETH